MTSHILLDEDSEHGLRCLHCYDIHSPVLPMTVERHIDECRGFVLMHKHCAKPKEASPQLEFTVDPRAMVSGYVNNPLNGTGPVRHESIPDPEAAFADTERERPEPRVDRFAEMYPMARTKGDLYFDLTGVLPEPLKAKCYPADVDKWDTRSGVFDAVAHWVRIEKAHAEAPSRAPIAGMYIPARLPMPEALAEVLGVKLGKKKRGARPLSSGKARKGKAT